MGILKFLILAFLVMFIAASFLVFSCIKLYRKLQEKDSDYHNQAFITALALCLFVFACALLLPELYV